ncbi:hypothetical protein BKA61DRAFT_58103 [Leptodontidium sp. MPI-SDFR-AT-0119]|nr:hypothetical protein BKA61DRAFT_58103 [Leptodontidium sp. MPI-SDFR-AT-0119]
MSSTISKLTAAFVSGTQETTVALASLNFDFSLVKVEAPMEFQGLGAALSSRRRESAEDGLTHTTARKLGALFEDFVPSVPTLFKAYGTRVSEIAASSGVNPNGTKEHGFWGDFMGADGTTIWAAATSGKSSIAVHLLACMLARIWTGPEATSIWVELVAKRKEDLSRLQCNESVYLSALAASQVTLSREQLREWDASARAWLQSADKEKTHQQLQLMLILNNIKLPVNSSMNVYQSVLQSWKQALETVECLLKGMPQRVQDGSIVLGLSAWHIYPDMLVLGDSNTTVSQKDPLVGEGGILTIGLKIMSPDREDGVFWSLPLAHLRYYGDPVRSERSLGTSTSRVTMEDLIQIALGCSCSMWSKGRYDISSASRLIISLAKYVEHDFRYYQKPLAWLILLNDAASTFLKSRGPEKELLSRLASFGQRRGSGFLAAHGAHPAPYFGLGDYSVLFCLIEDEEDRIEVLRNIAQNLVAAHEDLIIRYRVGEMSTDTFCHFEYASAIPVRRESVKRDQAGTEYSPLSHIRWLLDHKTVGTKLDNSKGCSCQEGCRFKSCPCRQGDNLCTVACHSNKYRTSGNKFSCGNSPRNTGQRAYKIELLEREMTVESRGEQTRLITYSESSEDLMFAWDYSELSGRPPAGPPEESGKVPSFNVAFKILVGDAKTAAIFRRQDPSPHLATRFQAMDDQSILEMVLKQELISKHTLRQYMCQLANEEFDGGIKAEDIDERDTDADAFEEEHQVHSQAPYSPKVYKGKKDSSYWEDSRPHFEPSTRLQYFYSLTSLSVARNLYSHLPDASVDLAVTTKPLHSMGWIPEAGWDRSKHSLTKTQAFACIAMFETGYMNLAPHSLEQVMAVSSGNSLFVAVGLLEDPWQVTDYGGIRRLAGNIGKAGLNLLVPPPKPRIGVPDLSNWGVINHNEFEGEVEDSFRSTSLHLSFTDYQLPIDIGIHGNRDGEAFFLESLVSVLDRGQWVADIDVLGMIESKNLVRCPKCKHIKKETYDAAKIKGSALTSIESWPEFLDPPNSASITHTSKNSYARIAAAAIAVQKGYKTLILPDTGARTCWLCVYEQSSLGEAHDMSCGSEYGEDSEDNEDYKQRDAEKSSNDGYQEAGNDHKYWMIIG